jgi:hypothetical protein
MDLAELICELDKVFTRQERAIRRRAHQRDRSRGQAQRHRLPDAPDRDRRPGSALRARRHDLFRRALYLLQRAADARRRHPDRRRRRLARRAHAHKLTPTVGRSYGIHAEPTTFGPRLLQADKDVRAKLSDEEIEANYDLDHQRKHVDTIFKRVFGT